MEVIPRFWKWSPGLTHYTSFGEKWWSPASKLIPRFEVIPRLVFSRWSPGFALYTSFWKMKWSPGFEVFSRYGVTNNPHWWQTGLHLILLRVVSGLVRVHLKAFTPEGLYKIVKRKTDFLTAKLQKRLVKFVNFGLADLNLSIYQYLKIEVGHVRLSQSANKFVEFDSIR